MHTLPISRERGALALILVLLLAPSLHAQQPAGRDTTQPVLLPGVTVSVLRPGGAAALEVESQAVREANPRDAGELLRKLPGLDAVRRGPLGLDPVVRGLHETQVGVFVDGAQMFSGSSDRMDSPMSHLDPSALESIEVVKGPYALTWGAGNMAGIRLETRDPLVLGQRGMHGRVFSGYDTNLRASEAGASVTSSTDRLGYSVHGVWREGADYRSGRGMDVPADFHSAEGRGKLSWAATPGSRLTLSAGYQSQNDIDYPGRLMNAAYFRTYDVMARWRTDARARTGYEAMAYLNGIDHDMTNAGKPMEMVDPMDPSGPPMAMPDMRMRVPTTLRVAGGRAAARLARGGFDLDLGGDVYSARYRATMRMLDDGGMLMEEDIVWPDATITDGGLFAQAARPLGASFRFSAATRLDLVRASAGRLSDFFVQNVSPRDHAAEANLSGSLSLTALLGASWSASAAVGSVVRTADPNERFADRIPSTRSQLSTEFVGNPALDPERCTQLDLWLEAKYPRATFFVSGFARRIGNYITFMPTDLPRRMETSPLEVFQYVNGRATFQGAEAGAALRLAEPLLLRVSGSVLRGTDDTMDEPAPGVSPARADATLRYEPPRSAWFAEGTVRAAARQGRVSMSRGEMETPGWTTLDLQAGREISRGVSIRVGVNNALDRDYVNHLDALDPYTMMPVPEPGRVLFVRLGYGF